MNEPVSGKTIALLLLVTVGVIYCAWLALRAIDFSVCNNTRMDSQQYQDLKCADVIREHYGIKNGR